MSDEPKPLTDEELYRFRVKPESWNDRRFLATIDALKDERDKLSVALRDLAHDLALNGTMLAKETDMAREAETNQMAAERRLRTLAAENVELHDAIDRMWRKACAGSMKLGPYAGWVANIESALKAPATRKFRAVIEAARDLVALAERCGYTYLATDAEPTERSKPPVRACKAAELVVLTQAVKALDGTSTTEALRH